MSEGMCPHSTRTPDRSHVCADQAARKRCAAESVLLSDVALAGRRVHFVPSQTYQPRLTLRYRRAGLSVAAIHCNECAVVSLSQVALASREVLCRENEVHIAVAEYRLGTTPLDVGIRALSDSITELPIPRLTIICARQQETKLKWQAARSAAFAS